MPTSTPAKTRSSVLRRTFRREFPSAVRGEGAYIWDSAGQKYLDLSGSAAVNFIGHGVPAIAAAIAEQAAKLGFVHTSQFTTPVAEEYAEELLTFAGENFRGGAVYFTCGGSESIETALKLARQYQVETGHSHRHQILSRTQSYHGATLGALSVSGNKRRREIYLPMIREFAHIGMPYPYRCAFHCTDDCLNCGPRYAAQLEDAIKTANGEAAAFIFEPVSGATLGAAVPPLGYLESIAEICRRHDILLIADEVMTGMGRSGRNFAVDHWNIAPDILVAAKGLSSGYAPLGAVIASKKIVDAIAAGSGAFLHGFTYNAHPISLAAGRAVLRFLRTHELVAAADSDRTGSAASNFQQALQSLRNEESVGDVRGIGLLWAVEFVADKSTKRPLPPDQTFSSRVASAALKRGLLVYPMQGSVDGISGDHILLAPPAIIAEDQIAWSVEQLSAAIRET
ncbi:MAG TPA: aminotransferase class III-fold pyridoxal phosphate-dependent enzyme [Candidatus Acidoferrales bacterium]|nr:aminotransferase class III-fold pyridoxal phosphate-dependent enzyme [Candidatus Acidoferrales bacterium]